MEELHAGLEDWEDDTGNEVSDAEWALIEKMFALADIDDDGHIDESELKCVVNQ